MILRLTIFMLIAFFSTSALAQLTANPDDRTIRTNTTLTFNPLSNDVDDQGRTIFLDSVNDAQNGQILVDLDTSPPTVTYTPNLDFTGTETLQYFISVAAGDGGAETAMGTITIRVVDQAIPQDLRPSNADAISNTINTVCNAFLDGNAAALTDRQRQLLSRCEGLAALANTDPAAATEAIRSISPEETLALSRVGVSSTKLQSRVVSNRMSNRNQTGLSYGEPGLLWSTNFANSALEDDSLLAKLGLFASIKWEEADKDTTEAESGFDSETFGLTFGGDYALSSNWFVGAALGWTDNELTFASDGGMTSTDISLTGYSSYSLNNFTFDFQLGFSNSDIDIDRVIRYEEFDNTLSVTAVGETNGNQWFASSQVQTLISKGALTLYPAIKLQYATSKIDGYAENEANGWEMVLSDQDVARLTLDAGVQATYAINRSWGVLIPNFELTAIADLNTDQGQVNGFFAGGPLNSPSFTLTAEEPDSFFYQAGIGFSFLLPGGTTGFLSYRETLGFDDFSSSEWQAGFRVELN